MAHTFNPSMQEAEEASRSLSSRPARATIRSYLKETKFKRQKEPRNLACSINHTLWPGIYWFSSCWPIKHIQWLRASTDCPEVPSSVPMSGSS